MAGPTALPWRTAWIVGASSGIGAETAALLAAAGTQVAISARNAKALEALAAQHANLHVFPLDVTNEAAVARSFAAVEEALGPVDLVLVAAGTYAATNAANFTTQALRAMYEVNYLGVVNVLAAILPTLRARRAGHVAWIASVAGYRGLPQAAAYGPTKAALNNLAESLQPELARDGVRVTVVNPGFVRTPMTAQNDFPMPFLMDAQDAARRTVAGLAKGRFEVAYPLPFVLILKFARLLPLRLYLALVRRFVLPKQK